MFKVGSEGDLVIVALCSRRRDLMLSVAEALSFAEALDSCAIDAEKESPSLVRGEQWGAKVESYDGRVAVRFFPPGVGNVDRVPLPPRAARQLAETVRDKASWAEYKMRLVVESISSSKRR